MYRLGEKTPITEGDITFYISDRINLDTADEYSHITIVDDKSINKSTLGLRRLMLSAQKVKLHRIGTAIYFMVDLLKLAKTTTWFIDTSGKVFRYKKSERAKLKTYKLKQVFPSTSTGCIIEVEGLPIRFKSMTYPDEGYKYAGILFFKGTYLLYGFYPNAIKETYRAI